MKVKISIEHNDGRKAEICIDESDKLTNLVIIQNVFNLFGISADILEMTKTFNNIGKAYTQFFNEVMPIEPNSEIRDELDKNKIKKQLIEGLTKDKEIIEVTYKDINDQPEFLRTGIKIKDGKKFYRLHYKCPACYNKGTHYIYENSKNTWCHRCQHEMTVYPAHPEGFPKQDSFGNFFRAGDFRDWSLFE